MEAKATLPGWTLDSPCPKAASKMAGVGVGCMYRREVVEGFEHSQLGVEH